MMKLEYENFADIIAHAHEKPQREKREYRNNQKQQNEEGNEVEKE